jgi:DNA primase catalytic subunit
MFEFALSHDLDIKSGGLGSHVWICPKSWSW